jgi:hypothetical protein
VELAVPKLRAGSYFPSFLELRRRAERALASVVATSYLLGVSTRRVEKLAASLGVVGLSKSQVSAMAAELDEVVEGFRNLPPDAGPYTFVWIDALTQKVREGGRAIVSTHRPITYQLAKPPRIFKARPTAPSGDQGPHGSSFKTIANKIDESRIRRSDH